MFSQFPDLSLLPSSSQRGIHPSAYFSSLKKKKNNPLFISVSGLIVLLGYLDTPLKVSEYHERLEGKMEKGRLRIE